MVKDQKFLYRKIYFTSSEFPGPVTIDVLRSYRTRLISHVPMSEGEKWEFKTVSKWIANTTKCFSDLDKIIDPAEGVFDEFIASIIPAIDAKITSESSYVCLHHTLIVLGMQKPIPFLDWVEWFNVLRAGKGCDPILKGSAKNNVPKYLGDPNNKKWILRDYLWSRNIDAPQARNFFSRLVSLCHTLSDVIIDSTNIDEYL